MQLAQSRLAQASLLALLAACSGGGSGSGASAPTSLVQGSLSAPANRRVPVDAPLGATVRQEPERGTLELQDDGSLVYRAPKSYTGPDAFELNRPGQLPVRFEVDVIPTLHVSAGFSNANDGSPEQPMGSPGAALAQTVSGDVVEARGSFRENNETFPVVVPEGVTLRAAKGFELALGAQGVSIAVVLHGDSRLEGALVFRSDDGVRVVGENAVLSNVVIQGCERGLRYDSGIHSGLVQGCRLFGHEIAMDFRATGLGVRVEGSTISENEIGVFVSGFGADFGGGSADSEGDNRFSCNGNDMLTRDLELPLMAHRNHWDDHTAILAGASDIDKDNARLNPNGCPTFELFVDAANGNDERKGRAEDDALQSITRALELSQPGDDILVLSGDYGVDTVESFPLMVPNGVSLFATAKPNGVNESVRIEGSGPFELGLVSESGIQNLSIALGAGSRLSGFSIDANEAVAVYSKDHQVHVTSNAISGFFGLVLEDALASSVAENRFEECLAGLLLVGSSREVSVQLNSFREMLGGAFIQGSADETVVLRSNSYSGSLQAGVLVDGGSPRLENERFAPDEDFIVAAIAVQSGSPIVRDCRFFCESAVLLNPGANIDLGRFDDPGRNRFVVPIDEALQTEDEQPVPQEGNIFQPAPETSRDDQL